MSDVVVSAEKLGKKYVIGHAARRDKYTALRDVIARGARAAWRNALDVVHGRPIVEGDEFEEVWALSEVSFDIKQGEVVGIIGRNGAGKSTLLKVLSRITEPSAGRATVRGRVASLLEVGTGFHPELTGRENIYLNGSILGMREFEIREKFDEIVSFAEIERYLDTPVKRYSSGMYLRLAFAVAAHLEPEILVVDEVLAVGDSNFQKKCLGKMHEVSQIEGRTVLFVSHNMSAVNRLCSRAVWLAGGRVEQIGATSDVVSAYLTMGVQAEGERTWEAARAPGTEKMRLRSVRIKSANGAVIGSVDIRHAFDIEIETEILQPLPHVRVVFRLSTSAGEPVLTSMDSADEEWAEKMRYPGVYVSRCRMPGDFLNEGSYLVSVSADVPFVEILFIEDSALRFQVEQTGGVSGRYPEKWPGVVCPRLEWRVNCVETIGERN